MRIETNTGKRRKCFMCDKLVQPGETIVWFGANDKLCGHAGELHNMYLRVLAILERSHSNIETKRG